MNKIEKQKEYIEKVYEINKNIKNYYYILTMGCKLNENDSEKLAGMLEEMNYCKTDEMENASIIIVNTCCVRENAEEKLFGKLGELKKIKEKKDTVVAVCGCMMQEEHIVDKLNKSYKFIDIIFGTHTLYKLPEDLFEILDNRQKIKDIIDIDGEVLEGIPIKREDNFKASVSIMYGCNNFCTYCIVPYVRGRERSRKSEDIIEEVTQLANSGFKEIMLLGQNVNSYIDTTKNEKYGFARLLKDVCKIEGIERIRFISPHPKDFTDDVIEAIQSSPKICKIIHLPVQSGSTSILKAMNRKYTKEDYLKLVEKMKNKIDNVAFSTDIIVGFPGETEEDFQDTLDVVKKVDFEQVYMFIYSKRVGTVAEKMKEQIPEEIKHERFNRLKKLVEEQMAVQNKKYVGTKQTILVEGYSKTNEKMLTGRTDTNKIVVYEGKEEDIGRIRNIEITKEHMWYLEGSEL